MFLNCDWQIDNWNSVAPDFCFYAAPRPRREFVRADGQCLIAAPNLVCEVWDKRTDFNDSARKPALYARLGVPLFWLIHPRNQTVLVHQTPLLGGYQTRRILSKDEVLTAALLPAFELPLADLFD